MTSICSGLVVQVVSALLRGNWQDFNGHDASRGPSAIAELFVTTAPRYASALQLWSCVCVCHKSVFYRNLWTNRAGFWHGSFLRSILVYTALLGNLGASKKGTSLWSFSPNSGLTNFCNGKSLVLSTKLVNGRAR